MESTLPQYITWLIPPVLGAVIGYVTNYIAIRMLFRPLRPWHIFSLRVPLTPGIIPSQRHKLARRMGEMVGDHLLTGGDISTALGRESFRTQLKLALADRLDSFLNRQCGPLITLLPRRFHQRFYTLLETLRLKGFARLRRYVDSEKFAATVHNLCQREMERLLARDIAAFLTPQRYQRGRTHLENSLQRWLQTPALEQALHQFITSNSDKLLRSERSLKQLLPPQLVEIIHSRLEQEIPSLLEGFAAMLDDEQLRCVMQDKARLAIDSFIDSVEGLSAIIAALFDMERIYSQLPEFIDKAVAEFRHWLVQEETIARVQQLLHQRLDEWLQRPLHQHFANVPYEQVAAARDQLSKQALILLRSAATRNHIIDLLEKGFDSIKDKPLHQLLEQLAPVGSDTALAASAADAVITAVRAPQLQQQLEQVAAEKITAFVTGHPIGTLAARLPSDAREEIYAALLTQLVLVLKKEIPPLVTSLDIQRIVEDKVNSLDILKVEELLMGIMKEQFKYINIFGALLGAIIGLLNLLVLAL